MPPSSLFTHGYLDATDKIVRHYRRSLLGTLVTATDADYIHELTIRTGASPRRLMGARAVEMTRSPRFHATLAAAKIAGR